MNKRMKQVKEYKNGRGTEKETLERNKRESIAREDERTACRKRIATNDTQLEGSNSLLDFILHVYCTVVKLISAGMESVCSSY